METDKRKQAWLERLFEYDEERAKVEQFGRGFYKWFLEFIRNCMVVAALAYVAQKSGSWFLYGIAALTYFALAATCLSYVEVWRVRLDFLGDGRLRRGLSIFIGILVLQSIQAMISVGLFGAIYKIVQTQGH
jgi:membrane associated rhomboid family serine protease